MKQQTALTELNEWIIEKWSDPGRMLSCLEVQEKIESLLPKEKQQIIEAHNNGMEEFSNDPSIESYQGEQYFQRTYEKD